jgi:hypothetical protein
VIEAKHLAASQHLPWFITGPGETDTLYIITTIVVITIIVALGLLFWRLHSLPERMGHKKLQFEVVAILCLLSLFTHNHAFWVAGLLLALIDLPDFTTPLKRMARALETMSGAEAPAEEAETKPSGLPIVQQSRRWWQHWPQLRQLCLHLRAHLRQQWVQLRAHVRQLWAQLRQLWP